MRCSKRFILVVSLVVASYSYAEHSYSEEDSYDLLHARQAIGDGSFLTSYSSKTLAPLQVRGEIYSSYAHSPLRFSETDTRSGDIVEHLLTLHFQGAIGLIDRLTVGFDLPTVIYNQFTDPEDANSVQDNRSAFGDLRLAAKLRLLGSEQSLFGLALVPFIDLPTGDAETFMSTDRVGGGGLLALDVSFLSRVKAAVNLGTVFRSEAERTNVVSSSELLYSGALSISVIKNLELIAELYGKTLLEDPFDDSLTSPLEAVAGLHYHAIGPMTLSVAAGTGIGSGVGNPDFRAIAGLAIQVP